MYRDDLQNERRNLKADILVYSEQVRVRMKEYAEIKSSKLAMLEREIGEINAKKEIAEKRLEEINRYYSKNKKRKKRREKK